MRIIDNVNELLGEDLRGELRPGSKLRIAASTFSIFAFEALRKELEMIDGLEFIFTSPTFVTEKATDRLPKTRGSFSSPKPSAASRRSTARSSRSAYATR